MNTQPTILLTFAQNDLREVAEEARNLKAIVSQQKVLQYRFIENVSASTLENAVTEYGKAFAFFHFSGHANETGLMLSDENYLDSGRLYRILFGKLERLQFVFLNGCRSYGHAGYLIASGVKAVLIANTDVPDEIARRLAERFYELFLLKGCALGEAFKRAEASVNSGFLPDIIKRNVVELLLGEPLLSQWTLLIHDKFSEVEHWTIHDFLRSSLSTPNVPKSSFLFLNVPKSLSATSPLESEVRNYVKMRYSNRLIQKLAKRQPINLRQLPTNEGTSPETSNTFVTISQEDIQSGIIQIFRAAHGRLLITGKPGAGKTTLLLELALALLGAETEDLPVLLNLATWTTQYIALEKWLEAILPAELGISNSYARQMIYPNRLILLLDGLDEVAEPHQQSCLEAIGRFRENTNALYVITSRIAEYKQIQKDAPVHLQIEVGDLTLQQIQTELTRIGYQQPEAIPFLNAIQKNNLLRQAAQTPFYFNTLQLLFAAGKTLSELNFDGATQTDFQNQITHRFVEYTLAAIPMDKSYGRQDAQQWLSFLADNLEKRNKVVFELTDLQYDWYPHRFARRQLFVANFIRNFIQYFTFFCLLMFSISFIIGFICIFLIDPQAGLIIFVGSCIGNFIMGLIVGLISGVMRSFKKTCPPITTRGHIKKWSWSLYFTAVKTKIIFFLLYLTFDSVWGAILSALVEEAFPKIKVIHGIKDSRTLHYQSIRKGITYLLALFFVLKFFFAFKLELLLNAVAGFFCLLLYGLAVYFKNDAIAIIQINRPYQRFNASMQKLHFSILQHFHLKWVLSRKGLLPYHLIAFLNDMVEHKLLESDGARWQFRHRLLQNYFAEKNLK